MSLRKGTDFLQWALPKMGYRWYGFRKPRNQVLSRIQSRINELELTGGFEEYREYLEDHTGEWETLDRLCDVTISKFFRDRKVWEYLRDEILPEWVRKNETVSVWSAGCCNGEEAYSLAIISEQSAMKSEQEINSKRVNILATDRNNQVLRRARNGQYPAGALKELTDNELGQYFHELNDEYEDDYQIKDRFNNRVEFEKRDIQDSLPDRPFDLVLCRNLVFTYFTIERQIEFLKRLKPHLNKDGCLVIGSNETLPETKWLEAESETHRIYRKT